MKNSNQDLHQSSWARVSSPLFCWYLGGDPVRLALSNALDGLIGINSRIAIINLLEVSKSSGLLNDIECSDNVEVHAGQMVACPLFGRRFIEGALTMLMGSNATSIVMSAFDSELLKLKFTV